MDINEIEIKIGKLELTDGNALMVYFPEEILDDGIDLLSDTLTIIKAAVGDNIPIIVLPRSLEIEEASIDNIITWLQDSKSESSESEDIDFGSEYT